MLTNLSAIPKVEENASDALSTSTNNSGRHSPAGNSPSQLKNFNAEELDTLCDESKKIRKKRSAYHKINDEIRLRLLEAVKHGETLKSAAKKFKINYSSAKSILHTYRKEGRILKKSAQERNIKRAGTGNGDIEDLEASPQQMSEHNDVEASVEAQAPLRRPNLKVETADEQRERSKAELANTRQELVDNLVNILKLNGNKSRDKENEKLPPKAPKTSTKSSTRQTTMEEESKNPTIVENLVYDDVLRGNTQNPQNLMNLTHMLQGSSIEKFKALDNIFSNLSASPFPIIKKAVQKFADSSEIKAEGAENVPGLLNEGVDTPQTQPKQPDEICMPHPLRFNTAQLLQDKIETKLNNEEDPDWDTTIENAAIETFKSFMDAQLLLCDALKKASYLNSLMQAQKSKTDSNSTQGQITGFNNI